MLFYLKIEIKRRTPLGRIVLIELDIINHLYILYLALKISFFVFNTSAIIFGVYVLHLKDLKRALTCTKDRIKCNIIGRKRFVRQLRYFFVEHNRITHYIIYTNYFFWRKILLSYVIANVPINVYFINYAIIKSSGPQDNMALITYVLGLQTASVFLSLYPVTYLCKFMHSFVQHMAALQYYLDGPQALSYKLQHQAHYEMIQSPLKITFTIGTLGQLTTRTMFEVCQ